MNWKAAAAIKPSSVWEATISSLRDCGPMAIVLLPVLGPWIFLLHLKQQYHIECIFDGLRRAAEVCRKITEKEKGKV